MIQTRTELKQCLRAEKKTYMHKRHWVDIITADVCIYLYRFVRLLRHTEYHHNNMRRSIYHRFMYLVFRRRKNKLGMKLGLEICDNSFDTGLEIFHAGNIVVNGHTRIGKNCKLHGNNCIGNNGKTSGCPVLGDDVRLGVGAKIIGAVTIADRITIAAGAVVIDSFTEPGIVVAGVPAKRVK